MPASPVGQSFPVRRPLAIAVPALAALLILGGWYWGLFIAPPDREMGEVQRLMYVHVPAVWMALLCATLNFGASLGYLFVGSAKSDLIAEASAEVGLLFGTYGVLLGSIWGRPTWGVWWTWDPRITSAAVMLVAYMGYLALRRFVDDPEKRARWSAIVGIFAFADIPVVWFSVRWWKSLHQVQSSTKTVDPELYWPLRYNAVALLLVMVLFLVLRYRIARARHAEESAPPELQATPSVGLRPTGSH